MPGNLYQILRTEVHHGIAGSGVVIRIDEYSRNIAPLVSELRAGNPQIEVNVAEITGDLGFLYINVGVIRRVRKRIGIGGYVLPVTELPVRRDDLSRCLRYGHKERNRRRQKQNKDQADNSIGAPVELLGRIMYLQRFRLLRLLLLHLRFGLRLHNIDEEYITACIAACQTAVTDIKVALAADRAGDLRLCNCKDISAVIADGKTLIRHMIVRRRTGRTGNNALLYLFLGNLLFRFLHRFRFLLNIRLFRLPLSLGNLKLHGLKRGKTDPACAGVRLIECAA